MWVVLVFVYCGLFGGCGLDVSALVVGLWWVRFVLLGCLISGLRVWYNLPCIALPGFLSFVWGWYDTRYCTFAGWVLICALWMIWCSLLVG